MLPPNPPRPELGRSEKYFSQIAYRTDKLEEFLCFLNKKASRFRKKPESFHVTRSESV